MPGHAEFKSAGCPLYAGVFKKLHAHSTRCRSMRRKGAEVVMPPRASPNQVIPGSELEIFKNCGHFLPEDQPEELSETSSKFSKRSAYSLK